MFDSRTSYHVLSRFLWVVCQLETLRQSVRRNVREILSGLPKTLDETYERVLRDIHEDNKEHARRLLRCLAVATRPLRVEELAEILTFDFDAAEGDIPEFHADWRWEDQEGAVLSTCSSLITITEFDHSSPIRVVQFSHFSVKEFLMSNRLAASTSDVSRYHILREPAHTILAQACLGTLLYLDNYNYMRVKDLPLAEYAAEHWVSHVQFEDVASRVKHRMASLFDPNKPHFAAWFAAWVGIYLIDEPYRTYRDFFSKMPAPLYHSSLREPGDLVERPATKHRRTSEQFALRRKQFPRPATKHAEHVYAMGDWYEFALLAALRRKDFPIAEILLMCGVSVDIRGIRGRTPLHDTIGNSDADVVRFLLEHGADANAQQDDLSTPLHLAVRNSQEHSVDLAKLLLERGADPHARDKDYATPWLLARYHGRLDIARVLLYHDAKAPTEND
jgi:hypothetical protein